MQKNQIYIIGLGWLGLALASHLQKVTSMHIAGTVRTTNKQTQLKQREIDSDIFSLYESMDGEHNNIFDRVRDAIVVLNIPPGRKNFIRENYCCAMKGLIDKLMVCGASKLIFISTSSVYGSQTGLINHHSRLLPSTESGHAHVDIENHLFNHYKDFSNILRPSGLVGPTLTTQANNAIEISYRHPINTLCHKKDIANARDPVNLVHQYDVIQAIVCLLQSQPKTHAFNLAAADHPTRQDYYTWCAKQLGLPIPRFAPDTKKRQFAKQIDASDTYVQLGFTPRFNSVYDMLPLY